MVSKPESRVHLKDKLNSFVALSNKEELDVQISENLISLVGQLYSDGFNLVGSYQALNNEPKLKLPLNWNISYPVVESDTQINYYIAPEAEFKASNIGILEPVKVPQNLQDKANHDAFIIPAVGFDQAGYRLGHGGGYYDRYLNNINKIKIGVGYSVQFTDGLWSPEEHDIRLNYIVTEKYVIKINN